MKIKRLRMNLAARTVLFLLMVSVIGLTNAFGQQYDFAASVGDNTLYFKITDNTNHYVQVVSPESYSWGSETQPTGSIDLPATISDGTTTYSVTSIGNAAFYNCTSLTSITFPGGMTGIGEDAFSNTGLTSLEVNVPTVGPYAFYGCTSLASMTIGADVTSIGQSAFANCTSLATVTYNATNATPNGDSFFSGCTHSCTLTVGNSVTALLNNQFAYFSGLNSVVSWGGVTSIGEGTFQSCGLTSLSIPDAITAMGASAFRDCTSLATLAFGSGLSAVSDYAFNGCTSLGSIAWGNVTSVGQAAFYGCTSLANVTFPSGITSIGEDAFSNTGLISLEVNVPTIGAYAFYGCTSLASLTIGPDVTSIGQLAFANCTSLASVTYNATSLTTPNGYSFFNGCTHSCTLTVGSGVTALPDNLFADFFGLNVVADWGGVTSIGDYTFRGCGFASLTIPDAITAMGSNAFRECVSLSTLAFGSGLSAVSDYAFDGCTSLGSIAWGAVTFVGQDAFCGCTSLTNVTFPDGMTCIGEDAFFSTGLTSLEVNVPTIGAYAFYGCTSLASLTIGPDVTSIGQLAFANCMSLDDIMVLRSESVPTVGSSLFDNVAENLVIYVPGAQLTAYKSTTNWSDYSNKIKGWLQKSVTGYGTSTESDKWVFIASPLTENTAPTTIDGMIVETATEYDLYRFNQNPTYGKEWENYKAKDGDDHPLHPDFTTLVNGQGYLYANKEDVDLIFKGDFNEGSSMDVELAYTEGMRLAGWNLVGNPFPVEATVTGRSYYVMNEAGTGIKPEAVSAGGTIAACTGIVVKAEATESNPMVTFSKVSRQTTSNKGLLQIAVANANTRSNAVEDKAIVSFNEGDELGKFYFGEQNANIYIPQNGEEYAIATAEKTGEMPLNFKSTKNGEYTITVNQEGVEMEYLHLIDYMTGANVNLLQTPEYTFNAKTTDYESRFKLVFAFVSGDADGDNDTFAFISNGNIIVNGEGTVQVIDVTGRVIVCRDVARNVSTNGMTPGVYVLRLVNGNDVKTQKMVIE